MDNINSTMDARRIQRDLAQQARESGNIMLASLKYTLGMQATLCQGMAEAINAFANTIEQQQTREGQSGYAAFERSASGASSASTSG